MYLKITSDMYLYLKLLLMLLLELKLYSYMYQLLYLDFLLSPVDCLCCWLCTIGMIYDIILR